MNYRGIALLSASLLFLGSCDFPSSRSEAVEKENQEKLKMITTGTFKTVMPALMKQVAGRVKSDGFASAVEFCNEKAPGLEGDFNSSLKEKFVKEYNLADYSFKRTALKLRNPKNAPDSLEKSVMQQWQKDLAEGKEIGLVMKKVGDKYYGMMPVKIPSPLWLGCHGTPDTIDAEAAKKIRELYPEDKATGFSVGDLRGALSVEIKL